MVSSTFSSVQFAEESSHCQSSLLPFLSVSVSGTAAMTDDDDPIYYSPLQLTDSLGRTQQSSQQRLSSYWNL